MSILLGGLTDKGDTLCLLLVFGWVLAEFVVCCPYIGELVGDGELLWMEDAGTRTKFG